MAASSSCTIQSHLQSRLMSWLASLGTETLLKALTGRKEDSIRFIPNLKYKTQDRSAGITIISTLRGSTQGRVTIEAGTSNLSYTQEMRAAPQSLK